MLRNPHLSFAVLAIALSTRAMTVENLNCEHRVNPLGVDVARPQLSWTLQSGRRGDRQTAYEVLVASSEALLEKDSGDLWDSGKVSSDETIQIVYAGAGLKSSQRVFWKVRAWNVVGQASDWSVPATWTTGILDPSEWRAQWISASGAEKLGKSFPAFARTDFNHREAFSHEYPNAANPGEPNFSSMLARREFTVKPGLVRAVIHVTGLGQYELSLNGKRVGDALLAPGWTDYTKTVLYDTFDITSLLSKGSNALGLILGNGMYNLQPDYQRYVKFLNSFGPLKALAQVRLNMPTVPSRTIGTDQSWQVAPAPSRSTTFTLAKISMRGWCKRAGINPDSRRTPDGSRREETSEPGGTLKGLSCAAPPIRAIETLKPVSVKSLNANTVVYDLGQNASIMPRLSVSGLAGSFVRIIPSELLKSDGSVDRASATQDGVRPAWWQYTLKGDGEENCFPKFFYQGGRYLQVELHPAKAGGPLPKIKRSKASSFILRPRRLANSPARTRCSTAFTNWSAGRSGAT